MTKKEGLYILSSSWTSKVITITDHEIRESVTFTKLQTGGELDFSWTCSSSIQGQLEIHIIGDNTGNYYNRFHDFPLNGSGSATIQLEPGSYRIEYNAESTGVNLGAKSSIQSVTVKRGSHQSISISIRKY